MTYEQKTGRLFTDDNILIGVGYAGHKEGKNNPEMESVKMIGPLPKGKYEIGPHYESQQTGPFTIMLITFQDNKMYGRSEFRIHGDSKRNPGTASNGCIIMGRAIREKIYSMDDKILTVI
jgi:hypothetical protein